MGPSLMKVLCWAFHLLSADRSKLSTAQGIIAKLIYVNVEGSLDASWGCQVRLQLILNRESSVKITFFELGLSGLKLREKLS